MNFAPTGLSPQAMIDALAGAVKLNNLDGIHQLVVVEKVDPNATHNGQTMMHIAASLEHDKALSILLEAGGDVHQPDSEGKSVLRAAIKVGNEVSVKKLLAAGADPTAWASEAELNGAELTDAELSKRYGNQVAQPVMEAVRRFKINQAVREKDMFVLGALLEQGVPPDTFDRFGKTALMEAAETGFDEGVEILLRYKANPNLAMKNGQTVMHRAMEGKDPDIVAMLFKAGAKMKVADKGGVTPLRLAEQKAARPVIDAARKYQLQEEAAFAMLAVRLSRDVQAPERATFKKKTPAPAAP